MAVITTCSFLSVDAINADLQNYVGNLPDNQQWVDFFASGAGQSLIELMAGVGGMWNYRIDTIRKENYLPTAQLQSSVFLIARALGYNPHRKLSPRINLRVSVSASISMNRTDVIGTIGSNTISLPAPVTIDPVPSVAQITGNTDITINPIVGSTPAFLEDTVNSPFGSFVVGQRIAIDSATTGGNNGDYTVLSVTASKLEIEEDFTASENFVAATTLGGLPGQVVEVIIGDWSQYTLNVGATQEFYVFNPGITDYRADENYIEVRINGVLQDVFFNREEIRDSNDVLVSTQYEGDIDIVFGDGILGPLLQPGDVVQVDVFETPGQIADLSILALSPNFTGITALQPIRIGEILTIGTNQESSSRVANLANRYYSTLRRAVTEEDYDVLGSAYPGLQDSQAQEDVSSNLTLNMSYIKDDESLFTPTELADFLTYMDQYRMVGVQINVVDPVIKTVNFKMTIVHELTADTVAIQSEIDAIIDEATLKLGETLFVGDISKAVSQIAGVIRVYWVFPYQDGTLAYNEYFKRGTVDVTLTSDQTALNEFDDDQGTGYI